MGMVGNQVIRHRHHRHPDATIELREEGVVDRGSCQFPADLELRVISLRDD